MIGMSWYRTPVGVAFFPATLAFALRLYGLSDKPLWLDEVITHVRANLPISGLIAIRFITNISRLIFFSPARSTRRLSTSGCCAFRP
jgi:hypothetical protein